MKIRLEFERLTWVKNLILAGFEPQFNSAHDYQNQKQSHFNSVFNLMESYGYYIVNYIIWSIPSVFIHWTILCEQRLINKTSTTPSCGGPLRAKIFRKVCIYEQKYDIWPIRTNFEHFKETPKFIFFNIFFSNIRFLSFIVTLSLHAKNSVPMVKSVTFGSLGPLLPFSKAHPPKLIKNGNFQAQYFLLFSFVILSLSAKDYDSITKIVIFGPFCPF